MCQVLQQTEYAMLELKICGRGNDVSRSQYGCKRVRRVEQGDGFEFCRRVHSQSYNYAADVR